MPTILPGPGIALATEPAWIEPHISETPLRGSTRRDSTSWVVVASAPSAPMMSWVRCGREVCPPIPVRVMSTWSTAEVIGTDLEGELADVGPRVAVQRVDLGQVLQHPAVDGVERAAGAGLLGRLEDQPDAAVQQVRPRAAGRAPGRARARSWCARRGRRRGRRPGSARRTARPCRPGSAARRCRPASRSGRRRSRSRSGRMSQYAPVPIGSTLATRPARSSSSTITAVVRCSTLPTSGWAWMSRRRSISRVLELGDQPRDGLPPLAVRPQHPHVRISLS